MRWLRRKAARTLFHLVHQQLGWPATALLTPAGGATPFAFDCANTGFLDYSRRSRRADGVEPEITGLFSHLARRLAVVYDIAANWGYYPLLLGTDLRFAGEVHAFEIQPRTAIGLRRVVVSAGRVHAHGLSDRDGETRLELTRHSYLARVVDANQGGATESAAVRRLDGQPPTAAARQNRCRRARGGGVARRCGPDRPASPACCFRKLVSAESA